MSRESTPETRAAHAAYMRRRYAAVKDGTWDPRRSHDPTRAPNETDLAWAAGFLEGEGSFGVDSGRYRCQRVRADQVNKEPVEKLFELFGGTLYERNPPSRGNHGPFWSWAATGPRARAMMRELRPLMSLRRQQQIDKALEGVQD